MLLAIIALAAVGGIRLVVWSTAPETRRFTLGMLAIAMANLLFVPAIGERWIDPHATLFGANVSDVTQHLLTLYGCYQFGAMTFRDRPREPVYLRRWRGFAAGITLAMVGTYRLGTFYDTPAEEFELGGPMNLAHSWMIVVIVAATFTLVTVAAIRGIRANGTRLRLSVAAMLGLGIVGLGCSTATGVLLAVNPAYIQSHYNSFAAVWTIPALAALAAAGVPGAISAWSRRNDPPLTGTADAPNELRTLSENGSDRPTVS